MRSTRMWQGWFDAGASTTMVARCSMIIHSLDHTAWCDYPHQKLSSKACCLVPSPC